MDLKGTVPISPGDSARPDSLKSGKGDKTRRNGDCPLIPNDDYVLTRLDVLVNFFRRWGVNWCRKNSLWPLPFATACCGIELMSTAASRYDLARFGAEVMRFSPRQADLLIVAGRVAIKMMPVLQRIYQQMCEPKWVISMGACASTGGVFDTYAVVQGIDQFMPVDVYVPGCPPRPETLIEGVMAIQRLIDRDGIRTSAERGRGYRLGGAVPISPGESASSDSLGAIKRDRTRRNGDCPLFPTE